MTGKRSERQLNGIDLLLQASKYLDSSVCSDSEKNTSNTFRKNNLWQQTKLVKKNLRHSYAKYNSFSQYRSSKPADSSYMTGSAISRNEDDFNMPSIKNFNSAYDLQSLHQHEPRCTHNELEKNRRANLKQRIEILRENLPMDADTVSRLTMLTVLTKANSFIKELEKNNRNMSMQKLNLHSKHEQLLLKKEALKKKHSQLSIKCNVRIPVVTKVLTATSALSNKSFISWRVRNQSNLSTTSSSSNNSEDDSELEQWLLNCKETYYDRDSGYDSPSFCYKTPCL